MKSAKIAARTPATSEAKGGKRTWSRALATSLPLLLGQGLVYIFVINGLGRERVVAAVIGLMLLAPVIVALAHAAQKEPLRRPEKRRFVLPKPLYLR